MSNKSAIINTTSVTANKGSSELLDYSSTKDSIVSFTRSLSANLAEKGIRVNGTAPGPIWTPLLPASFDEERTSEHGKNVLLKEQESLLKWPTLICSWHQKNHFILQDRSCIPMAEQ